MEYGSATFWWVLAGVLVAAELLSGSFYLVMLALGAVTAAFAAHAGYGSTVQLTCAAMFGIGAITCLHLYRRRQPKGPPPQANRDLNLDIGETVRVDHWDGEGHAQVSYRGASWSARFSGQGSPGAGPHVIRAIEGNVLQLDRGGR